MARWTSSFARVPRCYHFQAVWDVRPRRSPRSVSHWIFLNFSREIKVVNWKLTIFFKIDHFLFIMQRIWTLPEERWRLQCWIQIETYPKWQWKWSMPKIQGLSKQPSWKCVKILQSFIFQWFLFRQDFLQGRNSMLIIQGEALKSSQNSWLYLGI